MIERPRAIAASDAAAARADSKEFALLRWLLGREKEIREQLAKVRKEEAAAGGCCTIL